MCRLAEHHSDLGLHEDGAFVAEDLNISIYLQVPTLHTTTTRNDSCSYDYADYYDDDYDHYQLMLLFGVQHKIADFVAELIEFSSLTWIFLGVFYAGTSVFYYFFHSFHWRGSDCSLA